MKAFTALRPPSGMAGAVDLTSGRSDHQSVLSGTAALASSGQLAPSSIHRRRMPICAGESGSFFGGMR